MTAGRLAVVATAYDNPIQDRQHKIATCMWRSVLSVVIVVGCVTTLVVESPTAGIPGRRAVGNQDVKADWLWQFVEGHAEIKWEASQANDNSRTLSVNEAEGEGEGHADVHKVVSDNESTCDESLSGTNGEGYQGCQTMTRSGKSCQRWTSQRPHNHTNTPQARPNKGLGDHNYCRNPDGRTTIWCYTTDPNTKWEDCDTKIQGTAVFNNPRIPADTGDGNGVGNGDQPSGHRPMCQMQGFDHFESVGLYADDLAAAKRFCVWKGYLDVHSFTTASASGGCALYKEGHGRRWDTWHDNHLSSITCFQVLSCTDFSGIYEDPRHGAGANHVTFTQSGCTGSYTGSGSMAPVSGTYIVTGNTGQLAGAMNHTITLNGTFMTFSNSTVWETQALNCSKDDERQKIVDVRHRRRGSNTCEQASGDCQEKAQNTRRRRDGNLLFIHCPSTCAVEIGSNFLNKDGQHACPHGYDPLCGCLTKPTEEPPLCSAFACPEHYVLKSAATVFVGDHRDACCDQSCSFFICPEHFALKSNASRFTGSDRDTCCGYLCSTFTCLGNYTLKSGASQIVGDDQATCCAQTCRGFSCLGDYTWKEGASNIVGNDRVSCCDESCSRVVCPSKYILKSNAADVVGDNWQTCCDQTCIGFVCHNGSKLKSGASSLIGYDRDTCCDQACNSVACPSSYILKPNASRIVGDDWQSCCEEGPTSMIESEEDRLYAPLLIVAVGIGFVVTLICIVCVVYKISRARRSNTSDKAPTDLQDNGIRFSAQRNSASDQTLPTNQVPQGKKYHYFMSHKKNHSLLGSISASLALAIHDALHSQGFTGFFDVDDLDNISERELEDAVKNSCTMLVCLTDETCQSEWCRFEWDIACKHGIPVKAIVDLQNFPKQKMIEQVQKTNPYLLRYQLSEYTEKTRRTMIKDIASWLERRLDYEESPCDRRIHGVQENIDESSLAAGEGTIHHVATTTTETYDVDIDI